MHPPSPPIPSDDPFRAPHRWLVRLGTRFYFPIAAAMVTVVTGLIMRDALGEKLAYRRLADLLLLGAACVLVLFWRAERHWQRDRGHWLVRLTRPDLAFVWAGLGMSVIALGLIAFITLSGPNSVAGNHLWPLFLFPLLFLAERGETVPFLFLLGLSCLVLTLLRLAVFPSISGVLTPPLWLATLATSNYYLARRHHLLRQRTDLLRQVAHQLSSTPDIEASFEAVTATIGQRLRIEHLRVWLADPAGERLQLHAAWGTPPAPRPGGAGAWRGLSLQAGQGIPGAVLRQARAERWDDVAACPHHVIQPGFEWVRAALAVPLLVGERAVGVLEMLSPRAGEFWELDEEHLQLMADSIGLALGRSQQARQEAARLRDMLAETVARLNDCASLEDMFDTLAREARTHLGADLVVLYQLAPGTGYPLTPPLFTGDLREPDRLRQPLVPPDSVLFDLLERWAPYYSADAAGDPLLSRGGLAEGSPATDSGPSLPYGARNRFIVREAVRSVAFLPLGPRSERVGALFLHYRSPRVFSPLDQLSLEAFASLVAEQINRERAHWRRFEAFGGVLFGVHGPLTLSADSLRRLTGSARSALRSDPDRAEAALDQAGQVARKLEMAAMLTRLAQRDQLDDAGLTESLRRAATKILQFIQPGCRVELNLAAPVGDLPLELLDALYCVAMEAIVNAGFHGQAERIEVAVELEPGGVRLSVVDNGRGFDPAAARPGPNGIFESLALVERGFAAHGRVDSQPGRGTQVEVFFPCLPGAWGGGGEQLEG